MTKQEIVLELEDAINDVLYNCGYTESQVSISNYGTKLEIDVIGGDNPELPNGIITANLDSGDTLNTLVDTPSDVSACSHYMVVQ